VIAEFVGMDNDIVVAVVGLVAELVVGLVVGDVVIDVIVVIVVVDNSSYIDLHVDNVIVDLYKPVFWNFSNR
jgi:hypothetical protein